MYIKFKDLLSKIDSLLDGKINEDEFVTWFRSNLEIRKYIGLEEKLSLVDFYVEKFNADLSYEKEDTVRKESYKLYEISLVFDLLFKYTNIMIPSNYKNSDNYDKVFITPVYRIIHSECEKDYNRLVSMYERKIGINNIELIYTLGEIFGVNQTPEDFEKIKNIINDEINPDKLKDLLALAKMNNPIMGKVVDGIKMDSIKEVMGKK